MPRSGVLVRELDGEVLILDTVGDHIHRLNETAALIWRLHEDGADERAIADALSARFDVAVDRARADVRDTLQALHRLDVLSSRGTSPNPDDRRADPSD